MIKGTIKFFNNSKGFGFITPDEGDKEVFVPLATVTTSGNGQLTAGQRVLFETELEAKGPKAVKLQVLNEEPKAVPQTRVTVYHDASSDESTDVLAALESAGITPGQIDYIVNPPTCDELKHLSLMLGKADQSLARRYEALFMELQLDDRFISDNDFWTAIAEHPCLINGPLLVTENRARICKTAEDVDAFLGNAETRPRKPREISQRIMAMMTDKPMPPTPENEADGID